MVKAEQVAYDAVKEGQILQHEEFSVYLKDVIYVNPQNCYINVDVSTAGEHQERIIQNTQNKTFEFTESQINIEVKMCIGSYANLGLDTFTSPETPEPEENQTVEKNETLDIPEPIVVSDIAQDKEFQAVREGDIYVLGEFSIQVETVVYEPGDGNSFVRFVVNYKNEEKMAIVQKAKPGIVVFSDGSSVSLAVTDIIGRYTNFNVSFNVTEEPDNQPVYDTSNLLKAVLKLEKMANRLDKVASLAEGISLFLDEGEAGKWYTIGQDLRELSSELREIAVTLKQNIDNMSSEIVSQVREESTEVKEKLREIMVDILGSIW
jgi:hypothetical protein